MNEIKKLLPEELQKIQELQSQYNKFIFELGTIESQLQTFLQQKELLEKEKLNIIKDINTLGEKEKELVDILQNKYGSGKINPQTGEITSL